MLLKIIPSKNYRTIDLISIIQGDEQNLEICHKILYLIDSSNFSEKIYDILSNNGYLSTCFKKNIILIKLNEKVFLNKDLKEIKYFKVFWNNKLFWSESKNFIVL